MGLWEWLLTNEAGVRLVSTIIFGVSSASLAAIALWVAYRNNFGWKPVVLLISYGFRSGSQATEANCRFEVWNRRKYPVVVREMQVVLESTTIAREEGRGSRDEDGWHVTNEGRFLSRRNVSLEPTKHVEFVVAGVVAGGGDPFFRDKKPVEIWVDIFDPKKNGHYILRARSSRNRHWGRNWKRRMPSYTSSGAVRRMPELGA